MSNVKQSVPVIVNRLMAMQAGFQKDFTGKQSLPVEGTVMTQPQILAQVASELQVVTDADTARTTLASKVAAKKAAAAPTRAFLAALEQSLKAQFGSGDPRLQDFGIKPPKPRKKLTAEQKTLAVASTRETKGARGIMGAKQRAAITVGGKRGLQVVEPDGAVAPGLVTGPTPPGSGTPAAESASPAAPAAGAPTAGNTPPASGK